MSTATTVTGPAPPVNGHVEEVIRSAQHELNQLLHQRAETMKRIGTVKQTLVCLAKVFGEDVLTPEVMRLLGRGATRKQPGVHARLPGHSDGSCNASGGAAWLAGIATEIPGVGRAPQRPDRFGDHGIQSPGWLCRSAFFP